MWATHAKHALVFRVPKDQAVVGHVSPDGRFLVTISWNDRSRRGGGIRRWPLLPAAGERSSVLMRDPRLLGPDFTFNPDGKSVVGAFTCGGQAFVLPLDGRPPRFLQGFGCVLLITVDHQGHRAAALLLDAQRQVVEVQCLGSRDRPLSRPRSQGQGGGLHRGRFPQELPHLSGVSARRAPALARHVGPTNLGRRARDKSAAPGASQRRLHRRRGQPNARCDGWPCLRGALSQPAQAPLTAVDLQSGATREIATRDIGDLLSLFSMRPGGPS